MDNFTLNPEVDNYFSEGCMRCKLGGTADCKVHFWPEELQFLRQLALESGLKEERKWGVPCYTFNGKNVLTVAAFKQHASLSFFKGALLNDTNHLLEKAGANTQSGRIYKCTSIAQLQKDHALLTQLVAEAIQLEKEGKKVTFTKELPQPPAELLHAFDTDLVFKEAFNRLSPGKQRGYILYFSEAKKAKSRQLRIEKNYDNILRGEGLHDAYKSKTKS